MRTLIGLTALLFGALAPCASRAAEIDFTFAGVGGPNPAYAGYTDMGTLAITYAAGLTSLTTSNINSFTLDRSVISSNGTVQFVYSAADLLTFSASLTAGVPTSLNFTTDQVSGSNPAYFPNGFNATTTAPGVFTYSTTNTLTLGTFTNGVLVPVGVPEPASLWVFGISGLTVLSRRRRASQV